MSNPSTKNNAPTTSYPIRCAHTVEYFTKGIDENGPYYKVQYLIDDFANSDTFINFLLGYTTMTGTATAGSIIRRSPHRHPLSPNLYCHNAGLKQGLGDIKANTNGFPSFAGGALIEAEYRPWVPQGAYEMTPEELRNQIDETTPLLWCTQELDFQVETLVIPKSPLKWAAGPNSGKLTGQPFKKDIGITLLSLTFHKIPYMPATVIRSLRGKINIAQFLGSPADQVLFLGGRVIRDTDSSGITVQKVQLTFKEREAGWNKMFDPTDMQWHTVAGPAGVNPYTEGDFSPLLVFGQ